MDESPTTEETTGPRPESPDEPERIGSVVLPQKVSDLRRKLGQKAKQEPKFRFYALYDRIYRLDVLMTAWQIVVQNDGAPGVDGLSCRDIIDGPGGGSRSSWSCTKNCGRKSYRPQPVRRHNLHPQTGWTASPAGHPHGQRPCGSNSGQADSGTDLRGRFPRLIVFGFRPRFGAVRAHHQALPEAIRESLARGRTEVYDADLKGYFDTIPHDQLMKAVGMRVADQQVMRLLRMWLESDPSLRRMTKAKTSGTRSRAGDASGWSDLPSVGEYLSALVRGSLQQTGRSGDVGQCENCALCGRFCDHGPPPGRSIAGVDREDAGRPLPVDDQSREKHGVVDLTTPRATLKFLGFACLRACANGTALAVPGTTCPAGAFGQSGSSPAGDDSRTDRSAMGLVAANGDDRPTRSQSLRGWRAYFRLRTSTACVPPIGRLSAPGSFGNIYVAAANGACTRPEGMKLDTYLQRLGLQFFQHHARPASNRR